MFHNVVADTQNKLLNIVFEPIFIYKTHILHMNCSSSLKKNLKSLQITLLLKYALLLKFFFIFTVIGIRA